jgi:hypothetical protein
MLREPGNDQPFNLRSLSKQDLLRTRMPGSTGVEFIIGGRG